MNNDRSIWSRVKGVFSSGSGPTASKSRATAERYIEALINQEFAKAVGMLDAILSESLSAEKLAEVAAQMESRLGSIGAWKMRKCTFAEEKDVCVAIVKCQRGKMRLVVGVHPESQKVGAFLVQPA